MEGATKVKNAHKAKKKKCHFYAEIVKFGLI